MLALTRKRRALENCGPIRNRVLVIPDFDRFGGTRTYFQTLLMYYARHGWAITVVLTTAQLDAEIEALLRRAHAKLLTIDERPAAPMGLPRRFPFSLLWDLAIAWSYVRAIRPDLVVVSTGTPWICWGLVCFSRRFLYVLHSVPWVAAGKPVRALLKRLLIAPWLGPARRVLTVSDFAKHAIVTGWTGEGSGRWVEVVPNTTALECSPGEGSSHTKRPLRVLTAGHVTAHKNPLSWLDVAERVTKQAPRLEVEFVWAGDGDLFDACIREIACRRMERSARMLGYVADPDSLYHQCDVYFQPSVIESQGIAVLEAMKHGIPCVVSNNGGLPESVADGESGYVVDMDDPQKVADVLLGLLVDGSRRHVMAHAAAARYQRNYSPSKWEERMTQIHDDLMDRTRISVPA